MDLYCYRYFSLNKKLFIKSLNVMAEYLNAHVKDIEKADIRNGRNVL